MPLLLTRAYAAKIWGWHHSMQFVYRESDEYFQELIQYATDHNADSRENGWQLLPCFRRLFREGNTHHQDTVQLVVQPNMPDLYTTHTAWHLCRTGYIQPIELVASQHMFCLIVKFASSNRTEDQMPFMAYIQHMQTDPDCRFPRPLERFYYIQLHDWIARCETPAEVVRLLNAIQRNERYIAVEGCRRSGAHLLYAHLETMLRRRWLDNDMPRRRYVEGCLKRLATGWDEFIDLEE